jgi:hypothetical protein
MLYLGLISRFLAVVLAIPLLVLNLRLYQPDVETYGPNKLGADVISQLSFVETALRDGAGERMQIIFPEGFFFSHVLYGLAWVEVGMRRSEQDPLRARALKEARWALARLDRLDATQEFSLALDPPLGVFYIGWSNWLRGGVLALQPSSNRRDEELLRFEDECAALAAAFARSPTPFLQSYHALAWPVDSIVAVAALRLHDKLLPARYGPTIERWLEEAQKRLDPVTGLIPHRVDHRTGQPLETARGSSQSIIVRFLGEIDPIWGGEQYRLFRQEFVATRLAIPGVREHPKGISGSGDIDSGPLLFGISLSASTVTLGAALMQQDRALADPLLHASEATGFPMQWSSKKSYLFGLLPVGDAFLAWSKTARSWIAAQPQSDLPQVVSWWWRLPMHALSLMLLVILWHPRCYRR